MLLFIIHCRFEPGPSSSPVWEENTQCISRGNGSYYCFGDGPGITNCTHSQDVAISCLAGKQLMKDTIDILL